MRGLLAAGANPRLTDGKQTPLHVAARLGPAELVEALLLGGALGWMRDAAGRTPLDLARRGRPRDGEAVVALLDTTAIADPAFRAAVAAIAAGDVARLGALLDAEPGLLRARNAGPEVYRRRPRRDYFTDPKLFWYVANNPTLAPRLPRNIAEVARAMLDRGVDAEDLTYTLGLTVSSASARACGVQGELIGTLLAAGAEVTPSVVAAAAAHGELDALRVLLASGHPLDAPIAAALDRRDDLRVLLPSASRSDVHIAFGFAIINRKREAARLALDAGADVDGFLPVHVHSTALHQAAANDDPDTIAFLLARGARADIRDTLWDGTALEWARHGGHAAAAAALEPDSAT